eukprot:83441-Hanusia_phi.AAC.1
MNIPGDRNFGNLPSWAKFRASVTLTVVCDGDGNGGPAGRGTVPWSDLAPESVSALPHVCSGSAAATVTVPGHG